MCGFCNVWVCVCLGFVMCGCLFVWVFLICEFAYVWVLYYVGCICVIFIMCGCVYVLVL